MQMIRNRMRNPEKRSALRYRKHYLARM